MIITLWQFAFFCMAFHVIGMINALLAFIALRLVQLVIECAE